MDYPCYIAFSMLACVMVNPLSIPVFALQTCTQEGDREGCCQKSGQRASVQCMCITLNLVRRSNFVIVQDELSMCRVATDSKFAVSVGTNNLRCRSQSNVHGMP